MSYWWELLSEFMLNQNQRYINNRQCFFSSLPCNWLVDTEILVIIYTTCLVAKTIIPSRQLLFVCCTTVCHKCWCRKVSRSSIHCNLVYSSTDFNQYLYKLSGSKSNHSRQTFVIRLVQLSVVNGGVEKFPDLATQFHCFS